MDPACPIAARRGVLLGQIEAAARASGRDPSAITLVAVSKQQPDARIDAALASGQRIFGENRVQEAQSRWDSRDRAGLELRLIGPLQTNKARDAVALFDVIETVDRPRLAAALATATRALGRQPRFLAQVNTGEEPQKAGCAPGDLPALLEACGREGITIEGLMCIPPAGEPPGPHFALLAKLAARHDLATLSMGMSEDFETAVRFGATHVRVGSAFFGARD
jgi:pyridoxal phosphate enzyme (YggS family)